MLLSTTILFPFIPFLPQRHQIRMKKVYVCMYVIYWHVSPCAAGLTPGCPSHSLAARCWAAAFHLDGLFRGAGCAGAAVACRGPRRSPLSPKTSAPDSWHRPHRPRRRKETWLAWKTWLCCGAGKRRKESRKRNYIVQGSSTTHEKNARVFHGRLAVTFKWLCMAVDYMWCTWADNAAWIELLPVAALACGVWNRQWGP